MANNLGIKIKELRKKHNLSQQELAKKLGTSTSNISKWERDILIPDIYYIKDLCNLFNVTIEDLLEIKIKPYKKPKKWLIAVTIIETIILILAFLTISKEQEPKIYNISSSNKRIYIEGTIIEYDNENFYNITKIGYNNPQIGTTEDLKPERISITVFYKDNIYFSEIYESKEKETIEELLNRVNFHFNEKKNKNIDLKITITSDSKKETISTTMTKNKQQ